MRGSIRPAPSAAPRGRRMHRFNVTFAVATVGMALLLAACGTSTPGSPGAPSTTAGATPSSSAAGEATSAASPAPASPFDGIWATKRLTLDQLRAAVQANGMDPARFDKAVGGNPGFSEHVAFEVKIGDGRWVEFEVDDGVPSGVGWKGKYTTVDEDTFTAKDADSPCEITYDLAKNGSELTINVAHEECTDADDVLIQTAIYESAPFHLVEPLDATAALPTASGPAPGPIPTPAPPSTSGDRLATHEAGSVKGASLGYLEYLPGDYQDDAPSPLLVFLHGSGESGNGSKLQLGKLTGAAIPFLIDTNRWPDDRPFVVLMPQHADEPGSWCFTPAEVDSFLAFALDHYDIDPKRVYLTGLSCGAIGLWNYLGVHADEVLAAAVPIAGYGIGAFDERGCGLGTLPIWAFHGSDDASVVLRGDVYPMESLQACTDPKAVDARLTVYPKSGHDVWTRTYDMTAGHDIYSWMLSHTK